MLFPIGISGQRDIPLSHIGMQQAKLVGRRLQNERYTHVFASDLARASHTAQAIVEANQVCCSPIVHDKRLRERVRAKHKNCAEHKISEFV